MPSGGSRRGRRDNGLSAAEYAAVGDVDPRVGEHLLDVLAGVGIAAYLLPATDLHPVTRTTTLPSRPTDRLYADREYLGTAKEYLARLRADEAATPSASVGMPGIDPIIPDPARTGAEDVDVETAWARIVAGYDEEIDDTAAPWPAVENIPERGQDDTDPDLGRRLDFDLTTVDDISDRIAPTADQPPGRPLDEPTLLDALDTFGTVVPDGEEEEGYTPPPPPPVPRPPLPVILALLSIAAGLLLFFEPGLLPVDNDVTLLLGFCGLLAGVITLIWRLRPGDDEDDDIDDDGAVV